MNVSALVNVSCVQGSLSPELCDNAFIECCNSRATHKKMMEANVPPPAVRNRLATNNTRKKLRSRLSHEEGLHVARAAVYLGLTSNLKEVGCSQKKKHNQALERTMIVGRNWRQQFCTLCERQQTAGNIERRSTATPASRRTRERALVVGWEVWGRRRQQQQGSFRSYIRSTRYAAFTFH